MFVNGYRPKFFVKKKPRRVSLTQKLKNKQRYRKNKIKLRMYNKRWRQKNRLQLRRKRQLQKVRKAW